MAFPKAIEINEEGPREGFQIEKKQYPLAARAAVHSARSVIADKGTSPVRLQPKAVMI